MNKFILTILATLIVTGCDSGGVASVSAGADQSTNNTSNQSIRQTKELTQAKEQAVYVEKTLFPIIAGASRDIAGIANIIFTNELLQRVLWHIDSFENYSVIKKTPDYLDMTIVDEDTIKGQRDMLIKLQGIDNKADMEAYATAMIINLSVFPANGWFTNATNPAAKNEMTIYMGAGLIASEVMAKVASEISASPVENENDLKDEIKRLINKYKFTGDEIRKILYQEASYTRDLANSIKPVHFTADNGLDVSVSSIGIEISKYGAPWFGAGYLDGKKYSVRVSASKGASMKKGSTNEKGTGTTNKQSTGGKVNAG